MILIITIILQQKWLHSNSALLIASLNFLVKMALTKPEKNGKKIAVVVNLHT